MTETETIIAQLSDALRDYMRLSEDYKLVQRRRETLKPPTKPAVIASSAEYETYRTALTRYVGETEMNERRSQQLVKLLTAANRSIACAIPLKRTWFRVEVNGRAYAIASYTEAWGGAHLVMTYRPWPEDGILPELHDRLYYP